MNRFRPFVAALLLLVVAGAASAAERIPAHPRDLTFGPLAFEGPDPAAYRHDLPGGGTAFVVEDHALPLVRIALTLRTGGFLEAPGEEGLAGLTATMLRRGGAGELSAEAFDERLDFLATNLSVMAGPTSTTVMLDCLSPRLDESLDLLFAMLTAPRFDAERLAVEKGNVREQLARRNDDAAEILQREWSWLLYGPAHPAARQMTAAGLEALGRDALVRFHRATYRPAHLIAAVAGDVEAASVLASLARRLAAWKADGPEIPWPPAAPEPRAEPGLFRVEKEIPQGKVVIGQLGVRWERWDDPGRYALMVMNEILGGDFTSRITQRVRSDEGLAYSAGSSYDIGIFWPGSFTISYESKSATVALAAKISLEEIARIRTEEVSEAELRQAKSSFIDSFPRRFETPFLIARTFANDVLIDRPHTYWRDYRDRIRAVDAAAVREAAARHLDPERMLMLVVGDWAAIAPGDADGRASMGELFGGTARELPLRDPLTLEPRP